MRHVDGAHLQDSRTFHVHATMNRLVARAAFTGDQTIFEFACGTGPLSR